MLVRLVTKHDRIKMRLAAELRSRGVPHKVEALCDVGRVDILTEAEAIEVKATRQWKHGMGQALAYGDCTGTLARLHLYGPRRLAMAEEEMIARLGVRMSYDLDELEGK